MPDERAMDREVRIHQRHWLSILCSAISPSTQFLAIGGQHNLSPRTVFHLRKPAAFVLASSWQAQLECIHAAPSHPEPKRLFWIKIGRKYVEQAAVAS